MVHSPAMKKGVVEQLISFLLLWEWFYYYGRSGGVVAVWKKLISFFLTKHGQMLGREKCKS